MNDEPPTFETNSASETFARWQSNSGIELADVLKRVSELSRPELLQVLAADIGERWKNGEEPTVEEYVRQYPDLDEDAESVAFLAVVECNGRADAGLSPVPEGYAAKFPDAADDFYELEQKWEEAERSGKRPDLPGYTIEREIGSGGMGVVYEATDHKLDRRVALKLLRFETADLRRRFIREAKAIAALKHPNIVAIHGIGEEDGRLYLSLEYVKGINLSEWLLGDPQPPAAAAKFIRVLASAVHHAHSQDIIHRDLKPANILLPDVQGPATRCLEDFTPKITDFGLAKRVHTDSGQTGAASVIGTARYMAPEQARGENYKVGPETDVYALGVILYECLTGVAPFVGSTIIETIQRVGNEFEEPVPPGKLQKIPPDLETICLKSLRKDPRKRYVTAQALAEDLSRYLEDKPINARRTPLLERWVKWARRSPYRALFGVAAVLIIVAMIAVPLWMADVAFENATRQSDLRSDADLARQEAELRLVDASTTTGLALTDLGKHAQAVLWFAKAAAVAPETSERRRLNIVRAQTSLRLVSTPAAAIDLSGRRAQQLVFHPDGKQLLVKTADRCLLFDLVHETQIEWPTADQQVEAAAWSPDGVYCAVSATPTEITVANLQTGQLTARLATTEPIGLVAFSPDGRLFAATGSSLRMWNLGEHSAHVASTWEHPAVVQHVVFNGFAQVATTCADGQVRVFDIEPGPANNAPLLSAKHEAGEQGGASPPLFFRNGTGLVTRSGRTGLRWWDIKTGEEMFSAEASHEIVRIIPSPDGRHAGVLHFGGGEYWDLDQHKQVGQPLTHDNFGRAGAFSPDGRVFLTVSDDRTARLWSAPDGAPLAGSHYHEGHIDLAAFAPTGRLFATSQDDGLIRVWRLPDHLSRNYLLPVRDNPVFASVGDEFFLPTGTHRENSLLVSTSIHRLQNGVTNDSVGDASGGVIVGGAVDRKDRRLLILTKEPHAVKFWDLQPARRCIADFPLASQPLGAAINSNGTLAVILCRGGEVLRFDPATGKLLGESVRHSGKPDLGMFLPSRWTCFSPDDSKFATWGIGNSVCVWDAANGDSIDCLEHGDLCFDADFSGDDLIATASRDKTARIWKLGANNNARKMRTWSQPDWVFSVRFSPDSKQLLTACRDFSARLYDVADGVEAIPSMQHANEVYSAVFTPDAKLVITASRDNSARVWDRATGSPLTPPWRLSGWGLQAATSDDNKWALIGGFTKGIQVFSLADLVEDGTGATDRFGIDRLRRLGELVSGQKITESSTTNPHVAGQNLNAREWKERWIAFRELYPSEREFEVPDSRIVDLHLREATAAERSLGWFGAVWHYDRLMRKREGQPWEYARRANANAELWRWEESLEDYQKAATANPGDIAFWRSYALVHLGASDHAGYRRTCGEILNRFGASEDSEVLDALTEICCLAPLNPDDAAAFQSIVLKATQTFPERMEFRQSLGVALYRSGQWDKAITELNAANKLSPGGVFFVNDFYLALAFHGLGDTAQANMYRDRANEMLKIIDRESLVSELRLDWQIVLTWQLVQQELEAISKPF